MKCHLSIDEKWPIYEINAYSGKEQNCEISAEFYIEYVEITVKFMEMQKNLKELYEQTHR